MAFQNEEELPVQNELVAEANKIISNGKKADHEKKKAEKKAKAPSKETFDQAFEEPVTESSTERQLRVLQINPDTLAVKALWDETTIHPPDQNDGESQTEVNGKSFQPKGKKNLRKPHPDLINKLRKLVPHAMALCEIEDENVADYHVIGIKIDGDMTMHKSRVTLTMAKFVERTQKYVKIGPTSQVTLYGKSDYTDADKLAKATEDVEEETFDFLFACKHAQDIEGQLPLFV